MSTIGDAHIWVQGLDGAPAHALRDTDVSLNAPPFFWSPDSRFIVFSGFTNIRKVEVSTGVVQDLCDKPGPMIGGSWNQDGVIIFGSNSKGLWRVKEGTAVPLTVLDSSRHEREHELPQFLPDGRHFLYLRVSDNADQTGIYVGSLDDPPDHQNMRRVFATGFGARYLPSPDGKAGSLLSFRTGGIVTAQRFDPGTLQFQDQAVTVAEGVGAVYETPWFTASSSLLVYRPMAPPPHYQLTILDDTEKRAGTLGDTFENLSTPIFSPDGTRLALARTSGPGTNRDIWLFDVARGVGLRSTFGMSDNILPLWSPDGREIVFSSNREGGVYSLYRKFADGSQPERLLLKTDRNAAATSWSRDGQFLVYQKFESSGGALNRLWVLPLGGDAKPVALPTSGFDEITGRLSPDGRWLAYASNETGRYELYVREFTGTASAAGGGKWIVSRDGGYWPMWRKDGKELWYIAGDQTTVMSVSLEEGRSFQSTAPRVAFHVPLERFRDVGIASWANVAPSSDLKRFVVPLPVEQPAPQEFKALVNWGSAR